MLVFWRNGYGNTSMEQLVAETGVVRASLYATFGNKEQLFRRVVERYGSHQIARLGTPSGPRDALERWFENAITSAGVPRGCLVIGTLTELTTLEPKLRRFVKKHLGMVEGFFRSCLQSLVPEPDIARLTNVLMGANTAIFVLSRAGGANQKLRDIADAALAQVRERQA